MIHHRWSNSKQKWVPIKDMHTQHILNALREITIGSDRTMLDELERRFKALTTEKLSDQQLADELASVQPGTTRFTILRDEAIERLRGRS